MKTTEATPIMYCGIDVSKAFLDLDGLEKPLRFDNTAGGLALLLKALPHGAHLICEASGGYECALCQAAWAAGRPVSVVSPNRVRAYARSRGQIARTDRLDAAMLSAYGRAPLRRVLYMAAVTASQHNSILKTVYKRHRENGKSAKVALIAIARKLIELLNLLLKKPNFQLAA